MSKKKKNKKVVKLSSFEKILLVSSTLLFIILAVLVVTNNISWFDNGIYNIISKLNSNVSTFLFKLITFFCSIEFILLFIISMLIFNKKYGKGFTINIIGCVLLNQLLKHLFVRSRPMGIGIISESGYSFPSGHSMASVAFFGYFIYVILNSKLDKKKKILFSTLLSLLILLVGISRIYLGVHYASDVLAGFSIATTYLVIFKYIERKKKSF